MKNKNAVALGRLGGLKGGKARAKMLTAKGRKEIATKAAKKRWRKADPDIAALQAKRAHAADVLAYYDRLLESAK